MKIESKSGALISKCGQYRYQLWRIWDHSKPRVMFIMLNPSTANESTDDPTIRRCINFAKEWGYGGIYVANLFAYRSTNPKTLLTVNNPFGDHNIYYTRRFIDQVDKVICAWGNRAIVQRIMKNQSEFELLHFAQEKLFYLELAKDGTPKHPLYLKSDLKPLKLN